jgi:hypothetical protein
LDTMSTSEMNFWVSILFHTKLKCRLGCGKEDILLQHHKTFLWCFICTWFVSTCSDSRNLNNVFQKILFAKVQHWLNSVFARLIFEH